MLKDAYSCGAKGRFAVEMVTLAEAGSIQHAAAARPGMPCRLYDHVVFSALRATARPARSRGRTSSGGTLHCTRRCMAHLATAVERLAAGDAGHPSLFPVLALLARLRCRSFSSFLGSMLQAINAYCLFSVHNGNCRAGLLQEQLSLDYSPGSDSVLCKSLSCNESAAM